ncbi:MAG: helix-turn-helix transcriptional regulator [Chloroflexota bacterium]
MVAKQRAFDRGTARGLSLIRVIGGEIRLARVQRGLSIARVAREVGISAAELSRIERARAEWVSVIVLARLCAVVGLDLAARAYPGGSPIRDARHATLLTRFRARLHPSLRWSTEVPLPNPGDQRAWDAMIRGDGWRYGTEAELNPIDGQALIRRLTLKQRDGLVDGVVLLLPDTRQTRQFRREFADLLAADFPVPARLALTQLSNGLDPGGNSMIIL